MSNNNFFIFFKICRSHYKSETCPNEDVCGERKIRKLKYQIPDIPMSPDTVEEALRNKIDELRETQPKKRSRKTNTEASPPSDTNALPPRDTESDSALSTRSVTNFLKDKMGLEMGGISNESEKANNDSFEKIVGTVLDVEQETSNNKKSAGKRQIKEIYQ